jgi:hypothetical protein
MSLVREHIWVRHLYWRRLISSKLVLLNRLSTLSIVLNSRLISLANCVIILTIVTLWLITFLLGTISNLRCHSLILIAINSSRIFVHIIKVVLCSKIISTWIT